MAEQSKSKGGNVIKNVLMVVFIVAAGLFVWKKVEQRQAINQENQAIALLDDGKYEEARTILLQLHEKAKGDARKRHETSIARTFVGQAEDGTELSVDKQMELYRQAASYDETAIKNPAILRMLRDAEAKLGAPATTEPAPEQ